MTIRGDDKPMLLLLVKLASALSSQRGQTLAEYGLIISVVAVGVVIPTVLIFRDELIQAYASATECLRSLPGTCGQ
jgi:Flp pilus assembly pilin Flp